MHELPEHVAVYKQTRVFDFATTPRGFLEDHSTRANVWGRLTLKDLRVPWLRGLLY